MENKKYITTNYAVAIELAKDPAVIFNHLVDLKKWWLEDFEGENVKLNSEFVLKTGDGHISKNKVIEFIPDKKLVWQTTESLRKADNYDWTGTKFIFELIPGGNTTQLRFTYDGVVFEDEYNILVRVCDMAVKDAFYNFIINGKTKQA